MHLFRKTMHLALSASVLAVLLVCSLPRVHSQSEDDYRMKPVQFVMTRATGQTPTLDEEGRWTTKYPLSTVNAASLYGGLKYVHTEAINWEDVRHLCKRKNEVAYIIFSLLTFANPAAALAYFRDRPWGELGAYTTLDGGQCHDQVECELYHGDAETGVPALGPFVGGTADDDDDRAPYPGNWWYSLVGECPLKTWAEKTEQCIEEQPSGLCPAGVQPDGVQCTWAYEITGYVSLDHLVGITALDNPQRPGTKFANYTEFCKAGGVEFDRDPKSFNMTRGLDFWDDPKNTTANTVRTNKMIDHYFDPQFYPNNKPFPTPAELRAANPKCYENLKKCDSRNGPGCFRDDNQICRTCRAGQHVPCEVTPQDFLSLPDLTVPPPPTTPTTTTTTATTTTTTTTTTTKKPTTTAKPPSNASPSPTRKAPSSTNNNEQGTEGDSVDDDGGLSAVSIILILLGCFAAVAVIVLGVLFYRSKRHERAGDDDEERRTQLLEADYQGRNSEADIILT